MAKYAHIRNGMGDYTAGTGAEEDDLLYMSSYFTQGTSGGVVDTDDLEVTENGAGADMSVDVAAGKCFIPNSSYVINTDGEAKLWAAINTATENVTISTNSSGNDRIDLIYAKFDTGVTPGDDAEDVLVIDVEVGTPAGSPSAPATPSDSIALAQVAVANGASSITNSEITDVRTYTYLDGAKVLDLPIDNLLNEAWTSNSSGSLWTTGGGGEDIGNGSILSVYEKVSRKLTLQFYISFGSTTNFGSGNFQFALPEAASSSVTNFTGHLHARDNSTGDRYTGTFIVAAGASLGTMDFHGTTAATTSTVPFTWAASDVIQGFITLETAA